MYPTIYFPILSVTEWSIKCDLSLTHSSAIARARVVGIFRLLNAWLGQATGENSGKGGFVGSNEEEKDQEVMSLEETPRKPRAHDHRRYGSGKTEARKEKKAMYG